MPLMLSRRSLRALAFSFAVGGGPGFSALCFFLKRLNTEDMDDVDLTVRKFLLLGGVRLPFAASSFALRRSRLRFALRLFFRVRAGVGVAGSGGAVGESA
eukprot:CAMPEP_0118881410 /NCGR_PEP_ID=MMETSP1163-20130328/20875_1 /TAXON_ID=124430 /ORGANISM="Phaeomonas parva, Strain CCMP2877" /LENGTH=99 /DNA_ID=CAMNT_0006818189 /DNA_START=113 /DNA_END=408 /DNA_ORIENTATION=+